MTDPLRDEQAGANARVAQLEEEHARLEQELRELHEKENDPDRVTHVGRIQRKIQDVKNDILDLRAEANRLRRFQPIGWGSLAALLPMMMFLVLLALLIYWKK